MLASHWLFYPKQEQLLLLPPHLSVILQLLLWQLPLIWIRVNFFLLCMVMNIWFVTPHHLSSITEKKLIPPDHCSMHHLLLPLHPQHWAAMLGQGMLHASCLNFFGLWILTFNCDTSPLHGRILTPWKFWRVQPSNSCCQPISAVWSQ